MKKYLLLIGLLPFFVYGQEDDFDMSAFEEASDAKIYVTNKVLGLSPTKLLNFSFDYVGQNTWTTTAGDAFPGTYPETESQFNSNYGLRLETNYPVISNNRLIVNAYLNYWESRYDADPTESNVAQFFNNNPLRTTALGAVVFKPLDDRQFLLFQIEGAVNGNYNFNTIQADFSKTKVSASALYGWKPNDYTNVAFGLSRTYRGGRLLHLPVFMFNKTFNETWGLEVLLPARAYLRRNFSPKSFLMVGGELEGQSYHLQGPASTTFQGDLSNNDWELRKSEIRTRISWDRAITDFIWFNVQAGTVITYRLDVDTTSTSPDAWLTNNLGIPFYFRFGIQLVSP